ncbi:MAG: aminopeptidase [Bacilli bacterium]|nr:aminopeptidase [Bacilli bacterium]
MYRKNAWLKYENKQEVMDFAEGYKKFISVSKNERVAVTESEKLLKAKGYKNINQFKSLKEGDKVYAINRGKNIVAFVIGKEPIEKGLRILGAHIDSPRLDLKERPIYESKGFALADTHYYGGIKKYQWTTIPLALIGVVCKKDGSIVNVNIGDNPDDPVVGVTDLLIHLSQDQMAKTLAKAIEGENLDLTFGSMPISEEEKEPIKANVLKIIKEKYDIEDEDFISAEIEVVPAGPARDYGLDRSMIAGYGHDDRSCAYTSLMALLDVEEANKTACCILVDKEEVGSIGATGAHSVFFENVVAQISELLGSNNPLWTMRKAFENSQMLSSDVSAGFDPLYGYVNDTKNCAYLGEGLVFNKYTGSRGKSGCNDSMPEFYAFVRKTMDEANVNWQSSELGKVDQGGGGTIAYILGNYNMSVIDAGIPVLNMHAPMEIVSKVDVFEAYKGYRAFLLAK